MRLGSELDIILSLVLPAEWLRAIEFCSSVEICLMRTIAAAMIILICIAIAAVRTSAQSCNASTCTAASTAEADVLAALPSSGNTNSMVVVNIPAGTSSWTSQLTYTVPSAVTNLTIQGQTTMSCTGTAGTSSYACTPTANTVFVDSYTSGGSGAPLFAITTGAASTYFRLTGITFQGGTGSSSIEKYDGFIRLYGASLNVRVDHNDFNATTYTGTTTAGGMTIYTPLNGVVDHNTFEMIGQSNGVRDYSGSSDYGDTSWSQATGLGTSNFIFLENNIFNAGFTNDCDQGARMVIRYNTIIANPNEGDTGGWQGHQMGQGTQRNRSCRVLDVNHNYVYNPNPSGETQYAVANLLANTGVVWANTITTGYYNDLVFSIARETAAENSGDQATPPPNGIGFCGSNSNGSTSAWDGNSVAATGYPCIDQTGRGQGQLANGQAFPNMLNTVTGTIAWLHQNLEPWYIWNETLASGTVCNTQTFNGVVPTANQDFYCQVSASVQSSSTSPFNGTTGTGFGTLANRPSTCTAGPGGTYYTSPTGSYGVAYFATDTNTLYVCTATNTWTAVYTPYTYPHPLDGNANQGSETAPAPPSGLIATVQ